MAPTHSGATAPVRAQGPARYSVLEHGLQQQAPKRKLVTWGGEVTGKGSNWEITALCPDQTAGEGRRGTPDPFLNGTLGANMRIGSEGGRGH